MKNLFIVSLLLLFLFSFKIEQGKIAKLPKELKEISGLEIASDSTFYAINDGGNEPFIYEIDYKGKIVSTIRVKNAKNIDWEDITIDENYRSKMYIGDFGNNKNTRKSLDIYSINLAEMKSKTSTSSTNLEVEAEKISFIYPDQTEFPPSKKNRRFDCEAMCIAGSNQLMLFTKNNTKPYDGICYVYSLNLDDSKVNLVAEIKMGKNGYFHNSVTAADFYATDSNNAFFYLSTYSSIYKFKFSDGNFVLKSKIGYKTFSQKESLVVKNDNNIYVADEKSPLGIGPNLYEIKCVND